MGAVSPARVRLVSTHVKTHVGGMLSIGSGIGRAVSPTGVKCISSHAKTHFGGML